QGAHGALDRARRRGRRRRDHRDRGRPLTSPADVAAVIARMQAIDASLPANDGVAWFNRLYLRVTEAVQAELARTTFADAAFLARVDVAFANLYFAALEDTKAAPRAWQPLLTCRRKRGIAPLQFAFAGMNAHINYDLPLALGTVARERGVDL